MKTYLVTLCIIDGEHEYYSTFQHDLDPKLLEFPEHQRDKYVLKAINGYDYEETWCGKSYEDASGNDYRHYQVYHVQEIIKPEDQKILRFYGIY